MSPVLVNSIFILVNITATQASGLELVMYTSISHKTASLLLCVSLAKISNIMISHWIDASISLTSHTALAETPLKKAHDCPMALVFAAILKTRGLAYLRCKPMTCRKHVEKDELEIVLLLSLLVERQ